MYNTIKPIIYFLIIVNYNVFAQSDYSASEIMENVQKKYSTITTATAKFTQTTSFKYAKIEQSSVGTVTMKKGNNFRIETEQQTIVTDGKTVWFYSPINKQVLISTYQQKEQTLSPDKFLFNLPNDYAGTIVNEETKSVGADVVLKLVPKEKSKNAQFIKSLKVWVVEDDWSVRKIEYIDANETRTTYTLTSLEFNKKISDEVFQFTIPKDVEVVDLRKKVGE
mgnify:CR=1 FL=1